MELDYCFSKTFMNKFSYLIEKETIQFCERNFIGNTLIEVEDLKYKTLKRIRYIISEKKSEFMKNIMNFCNENEGLFYSFIKEFLDQFSIQDFVEFEILVERLVNDFCESMS